MKTAKLVLVILSIVLCAFVLFQSCAAGAANALSENGEVSGSGGLLVAILMLAGGIVMIATRKSTGIGGSVAGVVLYGLASLIGFMTAGSFSDLYIWSTFCVILVILNLVAAVKLKKSSNYD